MNMTSESNYTSMEKFTEKQNNRDGEEPTTTSRVQVFTTTSTAVSRDVVPAATTSRAQLSATVTMSRGLVSTSASRELVSTNASREPVSTSASRELVSTNASRELVSTNSSRELVSTNSSRELSSATRSGEQASRPPLLLSVSTEIIIKICDNLSVMLLWRVLRLTCRQFNCFLRSDWFWLLRLRKFSRVILPERLRCAAVLALKYYWVLNEMPSKSNPDFIRRFRRRYRRQKAMYSILRTSSLPALEVFQGGSLSAISDESTLSSIVINATARRCHAVEYFVGRWNSPPAGMPQSPNRWRVSRRMLVHSGTIDAVHLFRYTPQRYNYCATAARDRSIMLWDLNRIIAEDPPSMLVSRIENAHSGWIGDICSKSCSDMFSASWDGSLKQWVLTPSGLTLLNYVDMKNAVLACACDNEQVYACTFSDGPIMCDTRIGMLITHLAHSKSMPKVFNLATGFCTNYLYLVGEDRYVSMVDKRMFRAPVYRLNMRRPISRISYSHQQLAVTLRDGRAVFLNPDTLKMENHYFVAANRKIDVSLCHGGSCYAHNNLIKLYTPGLNPLLIDYLRADCDISRVDCNGRAIVAGTGIGSVNIWI